jgi:hypothetical protein
MKQKIAIFTSFHPSIRLPKNSRSCGFNRDPCMPTTEPNDFFNGKSTMRDLYADITSMANVG